jgi:hypothetical protein
MFQKKKERKRKREREKEKEREREREREGEREKEGKDGYRRKNLIEELDVEGGSCCCASLDHMVRRVEHSLSVNTNL